MDNKKTNVKTNPENEQSFKVSGLDKKKISLLKKGKLPLSIMGGLLAGVGIQTAFSSFNSSEEIDETTTEIDETEEGQNSDAGEESSEVFEFEAPTTIEFSDSVSDDMSFGDAFRAARQDMGPGGFFNWRGNSYHTLTKEEWDALSESERSDYLDQIRDNTNFEDGSYNKVEPDQDNDPSQDDMTDDDSENDSEENKESDENQDEKDSNKEESSDNDDKTIPEEADEFAELDELIDEDELLADLNNENATEEAEGIEGGISDNELIEEDNVEGDELIEDDSDLLDDLNQENDIEYDNDWGDDLVQGSDDVNLDDVDLDI